MERIENAERYWSPLVRALVRPYQVTWSMVALVTLIPGYLVIADFAAGVPLYNPELGLDRAIPLQPGWALVYGALYAFLIVLPVLLLRQNEHIRRTVNAYLVVWMFSYACFLLFPTGAPRPERVEGGGFLESCLRFLYLADPPYNCFPSIHVAHSFVSALSCLRLHPVVGSFAAACAAIVGISTLLTKQHYVLDVAAGTLLAVGACAAFLGPSFRREDHKQERRDAPAIAAALAAGIAAAVGCVWVVYTLRIG